jgi:hypothetical protein
VTDFIPELAAIAQERKASDNEIDNVDWETITGGALASHLAGLGRDASWFGSVAASSSHLDSPIEAIIRTPRVVILHGK